VTFLGVLGGMGPLATADFLRKLVENSAAAIDQEHIPVILYGDCTTPDRTANIVGDGPSPLPQLLQGVRFLNEAGVGLIAIPCNSAHRWHDEMQAASAVPIVHIVRASAAQVRLKSPAARRIGVLSTFGTYRMGFYEETLTRAGYAVTAPTEDEFDTLISPAIAMAKGNCLADAESLLEVAVARLLARGAEAIVLGCTELPVSMARLIGANPALYIDSNDALVKAVAGHVAHAKAA